MATTSDGPFYDDLHVGMVIPPLPPITLRPADNVVYRAISGDQHMLSLDDRLYARVSGGSGTLINPGLVLQYAIGQTTNATRWVIANLYYRSLRVHRPVTAGETLSTHTTVLGLSDSRPKDGQPRGKAWLGIETSSDAGVVAQYERCALMPCRGDAPGHRDDIPGPEAARPLETFTEHAPVWDLSPLPSTEWAVGEEREDPMRDHIDMAPALARLMLNQALLHRDHTRTAYGRRLVQGGHVVALAQASLTRCLPGLATVLGWDGCDHLLPAFEGDLLSFRHTLVDELPHGNGRLLRFTVRGARWTDAGRGDDILAWSVVVLAP